MRILARIQEMASSEIMSIIPAGEYERIKAKDKKPTFKAFVVGHEGLSTGKVEGAGNVVKRWLASAIKKLHDKLDFGLKVFHNHAETNTSRGRTSIGEIVGKALKIIDDRLSAIAIAYIKPRFCHLPLDVASIEADVRLRDQEGVYDVDVGEITGVALGSSAINKPGFAGATLLAQIQEFAEAQSRKSRGGETMELDDLSLDDIRQAIRAKKILPSDLFEIGALTVDPAVKGFVDQVKKNAYGGGAAHLQRTEDEFDKQKKEWEKKDGEKDTKIKTLTKELAKSKAPQLFEKQAKERRLSDQQKKFIVARLDKFEPGDPDKLDDEFKKYLDGEVDDFKKSAELLGVKVEEPENEDEKKTKPGGEPDDRQKKVLDGDQKYIDPEQNPMIPKSA